MDVRGLVEALLARFPLDTAEPWDRCGLSVGRPAEEVRRVAVSLDPTPSNIRRAHASGANVLVSHHPVWISAPDRLTPDAASSSYAGEALYTAAELGVSVIALHTNLDRSPQARELLPSMLGLAARSSLEHPFDPARPGLGAWCEADAPCALGALAERAAAAFGTEPRVWGGIERRVRRIAFLGGSLGEFGVAAAELGADVVITGEAGYHTCQDVCERGTSLILLGHDRSEEPFRGIIREALVGCGVDEGEIVALDGGRPWRTVKKGELA